MYGKTITDTSSTTLLLKAEVRTALRVLNENIQDLSCHPMYLGTPQSPSVMDNFNIPIGC